jgi:hypothetical protein
MIEPHAILLLGSTAASNWIIVVVILVHHIVVHRAGRKERSTLQEFRQRPDASIDADTRFALLRVSRIARRRRTSFPFVHSLAPSVQKRSSLAGSAHHRQLMPKETNLVGEEAARRRESAMKGREL